MADIQDIKVRVRALMMKAADTAATPSEAESAMRLAQKLMAKYQVSEADLGSLHSEDFKILDRVGSKHKTKGWYLHPVEKYCATTVGKFCGVRPWMATESDGSLMLRCLGLESDVEMFNWMIAAFRDQFEHDWLIYKRFQMESKRLLDIAEARRAFSQGFSKAVNDRLRDWLFRESPAEGSSDGTALVVKKMSLVEAEMARRGIVLGGPTAGGRPSDDHTAAGAGYNSGKAAQAARATAGQGATIMIGRG